MSVFKTETILIFDGAYTFTKMPVTNYYPNGYILVRDAEGASIMKLSPADLKQIADTFCE